MRHATLIILFLSAVTHCSALWANEPTVVGSLVVKLIDEVEVPALEQGALLELNVELGDTVKTGQVLARVDDRDSVAQRDLSGIELGISRQKSTQYRDDDVAMTQWKEALAALEQKKLVAEIAGEESDNEVRVSAAEKAESVALNEWTRARTAREKFADSVSESELENLRLQYERAKLERVQAAFERRMDRLTAESERQAVKVAELAAQRAEIQRAVATANVELLALDTELKEKSLLLRQQLVKRHAVVSSIDGVVVEIYKRPGEWVRPGDSVVRVINLNQLHAEGFLSGNVRPKRGQKVVIVSEASSEETQKAEGTIDFVSPERDLVSGEFRFLVRLSGAPFLPGDRVEIEW